MGGGPVLSPLFDGWINRKLDKYNDDMDTYDHTNRGSRPFILFAGYCSQRTKFWITCYR